LTKNGFLRRRDERIREPRKSGVEKRVASLAFPENEPYDHLQHF